MTNDPGRPFSFDDAFEATPSRPVPTASPVEVGSRRFVSSYATTPARPPRPTRQRRGQSLSWISVALAGLGALAVGFGLYFALARIEISTHPLQVAADWMTLALVGLCLLVISLATSIVALVRARPRLVAVLALLATFILPVLAALVGIKFGLDVFAATAQAQTTDIGEGALSALVETLERNGIDPGPIVRFLVDLLG